MVRHPLPPAETGSIPIERAIEIVRFPLTFCVLPALLIVFLGPAALHRKMRRLAG